MELVTHAKQLPWVKMLEVQEKINVYATVLPGLLLFLPLTEKGGGKGVCITWKYLAVKVTASRDF